MEATLTTAVERQSLDLDRFLELWPLLTSKHLLQALEAAAGKTVSIFVAAPEDGTRVEILVNHDDARAAVDDGSGCRAGAYQEEGDGAAIALEDGAGSWRLAGRVSGTVLRFVPL